MWIYKKYNMHRSNSLDLFHSRKSTSVKQEGRLDPFLADEFFGVRTRVHVLFSVTT